MQNNNDVFTTKDHIELLEIKVKGLQIAVKSIFSWMREIDQQLNDSNDDIIADATPKDGKEAHEPLLMCVLPHPCDGPAYNGWSTADYMAKVTEEYGEMVKAYHDWQKYRRPGSRKQFLRECTDCIVSITSLMNKADADLQERQHIMNEVNQSNSVRDGGRRFKKGL